MAEKLSLKLDSTPKPKRNLIALLAIFLSCFGIATIITGLYVINFVARQEQAATNNPDIATANWRIKEVLPNPDKPGTRNITLISSIGNLRSYPNVRAFGISRDGKLMATTTGDGAEVVDLATDIHTPISLPFAVSRDIGETITWSYNREYFALPVADAQTQEPYLILVNAQTQQVTAVPTPLFAGSDYPTLFNPNRNLLLTLIYDESENLLANPEERSALLAIVDVTGKRIWERTIKTAKAPGKITYRWDSTGDYVQYYVDTGNSAVNIYSEHLMAKVFWENEMIN